MKWKSKNTRIATVKKGVVTGKKKKKQTDNDVTKPIQTAMPVQFDTPVVLAPTKKPVNDNVALQSVFL